MGIDPKQLAVCCNRRTRLSIPEEKSRAGEQQLQVTAGMYATTTVDNIRQR